MGYEAVKEPDRHRKNRSAKQKSHSFLPALVAVSGACGLAATPVNALELGDVRIESTLGQPLRASIAYALNPNEQLFDFCIYLRPGAVDAAIPTISRARVTITNNTIILTGNTPIKDPLLSMQVAVDCPYTPNLSRQYTMIVDPVLHDATTRFAAVSKTNSAVAPTQRTASTVQQPRAAAVPARTPTNETTLDESPIAAETEYLVQVGDSISGIASRIENRTIGLWPAISVIVSANPGAFIEGDPNKLMAGSVLIIPELTGVPVAGELPAELPVADAPQQFDAAEPGSFESDVVVDLPDPVQQPAVAASVEPVAEPAESAREFAPIEPVAVIDEAVVGAAIAAAIADEIFVEDPISEDIENASSAADPGLRPGDIIVSTESSGAGNAAVAPVANRASSSTTSTSGAWSWLIWLGGSGLAIIGGLFLFGRKLREMFSSVAVGAPQESVALSDAEPTQTNPAITDVDFQFDDVVPQDAISLDADLDVGTGLQDSSEIDVAQDFGFTASGQVENKIDHELTEEAAREIDEEPTDMISPSHREEESSILDTEISSEDDDYDMSMIVDATKQSIDEFDATAKDLHAVQLGSPSEDEYVVSDDTLNQDVDLQVLEQDYEDEFTATQALNIEIEKAAAELVNNMEEHESALSPEALALEPTAEMPARSHDPEFTAELTANIPADIEAVNDDDAIQDDPDITSKLAAAGSDITVEMQIESGKVDTKKKS